MSETVELGDDDHAVVLRSDGTLCLIAAFPEDEHEDVSEDILVLSAFMVAFRDEQFRDYILALFHREGTALN